MAAPITDPAGDEIPPEDLEQHFKTALSTTQCPNLSTQTSHDRKTCCLVKKGCIFAYSYHVSCNVINAFPGLRPKDREWGASVAIHEQ